MSQPWVHPPSSAGYSSGSSSPLLRFPPWPWFPPLCLWTPQPWEAPHWLLLYSAWPGHAPCHSRTPVGIHRQRQRTSDYLTQTHKGMRVWKWTEKKMKWTEWQPWTSFCLPILKQWLMGNWYECGHRPIFTDSYFTLSKPVIRPSH